AHAGIRRRLGPWGDPLPGGLRAPRVWRGPRLLRAGVHGLVPWSLQVGELARGGVRIGAGSGFGGLRAHGDQASGPSTEADYALAVNRAMERTRDRDRAALPEPMRRDVRLLGDILGAIIRDSGGPGLLADVERLRHAVIDARHEGGRGGGRGDAGDRDAGDEIAALVASWSLEQAEQVARAFAVYFPLANLAEEHQRIRNLRERDTGAEPVRESLAAAVAEIGHDAGPEHLRELIASLRVHLVLTAHPTEARRRAVVAALRRISRLLDVLDDQRAAAADHA